MLSLGSKLLTVLSCMLISQVVEFIFFTFGFFTISGSLVIKMLLEIPFKLLRLMKDQYIFNDRSGLLEC